MNITPHMITDAYEFLHKCYPFSGWNLPEADAVEFKTDMRKNVVAEHNYRSRNASLL